MTAARQKRKRSGSAAPAFRSVMTAIVALVPALVLVAVPAAAQPAITERVVADWHSGLAIGGYDPVAFFTDGKPVEGSAAFELRYGGVIWRFCNSGNRAAFVADPEIYVPQFGGYDPIGVIRGTGVAGKPNVWLIIGQRLYLFYDQARLDRFAAEPDRLQDEAERAWPEVLRTLSP
jgi:YHS domain-containing protein